MLIFYIVTTIIFNSSCSLFNKTNNNNGFETISSSNINDSLIIDTLINDVIDTQSVLKPIISQKDTIIWTDTLMESELKKYVIQYIKVKGEALKRDTIGFIDLTETVDTAYKPQMQRAIRKKDSYNIALILPFRTELFSPNSEIPIQSLRALEFYEGIKIALDSLDKEGINLNVHVFDSKRDVEELNIVLNKMKDKEWDLIIGPNSSEVLEVLADSIKSMQSPLVVPFNSNSDITKENMYYIQTSPSFLVYANTITRFLGTLKVPARGNLKKINYLLLGMQEDSLNMDMIQKSYALSVNDERARLPQLIADERLSINNIREYFSKDALNVVVIPSDRSERFVISSLREISTLYDKVEKNKSFTFLVIGMPYWKYFERVNFEYFENLQLHIPDNVFIDKKDPLNKKFEEDYRNIYGIAPREFAYEGFDIMLYFGRILDKYGTAFPDYLDQSMKKCRHTIFQFAPVFNDPKQIDGPNQKEYRLIERYENQYLNILKFEDFDFEAVDWENN